MTPPQPHDQAQDHTRAVAGMFGRIAPVYDLLNRVLSLGRDQAWRKALIQEAAPPTAGYVLDLAAGTLDVSRMLLNCRPRLHVIAADISLPMLQKGRPKANRAHLSPLLADGRLLPFRKNSVDCVTIAFGLRNIVPRSAAYQEILRVLNPGGKLCVLEFGSGSQRILGGSYNLYLARLLPAIGRLVSKDAEAYSYLARTIQAFPNSEALRQEMLDAGFSRVRARPLTAGIVCLHTAVK